MVAGREVLAYSSDSDGNMAIFIRDLGTGATRKLTAPFSGPRRSWRGRLTGRGSRSWTRSIWRLVPGRCMSRMSRRGGHEGVGDGEFDGININADFEPGRPTWGPDSNTIALAILQQYSNRFREGVSKIQTVNATTGATNGFSRIPRSRMRRSRTGWRTTVRSGRRTAR